MRCETVIFAVLTAVLLLLGGSGSVPSKAATALSTDGEATVYLMGDFTSDFDLRYRATLSASVSNRSWSTIGIMLLGRANPGRSVEIGLANGDPDGQTVVAFTSARYP